MNQFDSMISKLVQWGNETEKLFAVIVIGSQARSCRPADEFSDLDLILAVDDPDIFLQSDQWLKQLGEFHISFTENTLGGGRERRVLFDGALDVDFIVLSRDQFEEVLHKDLFGMLIRGYRVLIDKIGLEQRIPSVVDTPKGRMSEQDFTNLINDFWYHGVWAIKKLVRGELWIAKSCVDSYLKGLLLAMIECHAHAVHGMEYDTWHNGRFLEEWADAWIVQRLGECFSRYDKDGIKDALLATMDLFRLMAVEAAQGLGYEYPVKADRYSTEWVNKIGASC